MRIIKKIVKKITPPHTPVGRQVKKYASRMGLAKDVFYDEEYSKWIQQTEPHMFYPAIKSSYNSDSPLFSIVIPFYNTKERYLSPLFESIVNQTYQDWELIVGDGSNDPAIAQKIKKYSEQDSRIKYYHFMKNTDISGNTNQAIDRARGKYIVFCDHDDTLSKHALNEAAILINEHNDVEIIYSDEDKLSDNGKLRHSPYFKPDWSPHVFLYTNYTNHLSIVKSDIVKKVGGLNKEFNGSQDYEFLLRAHAMSEQPIVVKHIPKILYHWREAAGSTAVSYGRKSYAFHASKQALLNYFNAKKIEVEFDDNYDAAGYFKEQLRPDMSKTIEIVANISDDKKTNQAFIEQLKLVTISDLDHTFTIEKTGKKDVTVEISEFVLPESKTWLDDLAGVLRLSYTAAVSPRILSADGSRIIDMGKVYDKNGELVSVHENHGTDDLTIHGGAKRVRNVDVLSGSIVAYRTIQGPKATKDQYNVVWAPVSFRKYEVFKSSRYFNPNLRVTEDNRITVNE